MAQMNLGISLVGAALLLLAASCGGEQAATSEGASTSGAGGTGGTGGAGGASGAPARVYAVFVTHNEVASMAGEGLICAPIYATKAAYTANRKLVKRLADEIKSRDMVWHFQSDADFLKAVAMYDAAPDVTADTGGKNIIAYAASLSPNIITDAHHHPAPGTGNYADVAKQIQDLGGSEQGDVGGFLAAPVDKSEVDSLLAAAKMGLSATAATDPSFTWFPKILWGGGSPGHTMDLNASGIWRPKSAAEVTVHDPAGPIPCVGGYTGTQDGTGITELVTKLRAGQLEAGHMYTVTLIANQCELTDAIIDQTLAIIDSHNQDVKDGVLVWKTLPETVKDWETVYGGEGFHTP